MSVSWRNKILIPVYWYVLFLGCWILEGDEWMDELIGCIVGF